MSLFVWNPAWETGVLLIDEEHRGLFLRFEALSVALHDRREVAEVAELVGFLAEYANTHFANEEKIMWLAQYHGLDEHRAIHDGMRQHINQMVESDGGGPDIAIGKALEFLTNWLIDHINTADRQMASHVRNYLSQASYWHVPRERESG